MKITYDPHIDAAYTRLKRGRVQVTTHRLTEIEVLDASKYVMKHRHPQVELENLRVAK